MNKDQMIELLILRVKSGASMFAGLDRHMLRSLFKEALHDMDLTFTPQIVAGPGNLTTGNDYS